MEDITRNYKPRTVQELSILTPSIDWPLLLQEIFPAGYNDTLPLIVPNTVYLAKLDTLLQKTPAKTLQHYFSWILIRNLAKYLSPPYQQPLTTISNVASYVFFDVGIDRESICLSTVSYNLAHIASHYVAQRSSRERPARRL
jgi:endothelin-converting enzyme